MPKVFWTYDEHRRLVPRVYELMESDRNVSLLEAVRSAQAEVLDPSRQRNLVGQNSIAKVGRLLDDYRETLRNADEIGQQSVLGEKLRHAIQAGVEGALRQIVRDELQIFESRMLRHMGKAPLLRPVDTPPPDEPRPPREVTKLAKVLVVGLLPEQQQTIMRRFGARLEFRFVTSSMITSSQGAHRLDALSESCDATFGMVRFMRHEAEQSINRKRYIRVTGSTSNLEVCLTDYIRELEHGKARKTS